MKESFYVYCLYQGLRIVYVGSTTKIYSRLDDHIKSKRFDCVKFSCLPDKESMLATEIAHISIYKPVYNTAGIYKTSDDVDVTNLVWEDICPLKLMELMHRQQMYQTPMSFDGLFIPKDFLSAKEFYVHDKLVKLSLIEKVVYLHIKLHFENGEDMPTYKQIAIHIGCDSKTVARAFGTLKENKVIETINAVGNKTLVKSLVDLINNS